MRNRLLAVLFTGAFCLTAGAQSITRTTPTVPGVRGIAFEPLNPVAGQEVSVILDQPSCGWYVEAARDGSQISVDQYPNPLPTLCPSVIPPARVRIAMGALPAGEYLVRNAIHGDGTFPAVPSSRQESLLVVAAASEVPANNYAGLWNDPATPGWGIGLIQSAAGQVFATLYAYDAGGNPVWHSVPGGVWTTPSRFEGTLLAANSAGGPVTSPYQAVNAVGRLALQFDSPTTASLTYVIYAFPPPGTDLSPLTPIRYAETRAVKKQSF